MSGFDRVARVYHALEFAAFGGALQRARTAHIARLRHCDDILILGDGDGRFLTALLPIAPHARVHCVDASRAMQDLAAARVGAADRDRVTFECADARALDLGARRFDAVVTLFFLDCLTAGEVDALIARTTPHLRPRALWLFADFAIPPRGLARLHARVIVGTLYRFFQWRAGLEVQTLPPSEALLERAGFVLEDERGFRAGLIRSTVYALRS